jgi:hypothetical protein
MAGCYFANTNEDVAEGGKELLSAHHDGAGITIINREREIAS